MTKSYSGDETEVNLRLAFRDAWRQAGQSGLFGFFRLFGWTNEKTRVDLPHFGVGQACAWLTAVSYLDRGCQFTLEDD